METLVKIKNTAEGKSLLAFIKSLNYAHVLGDSNDYINITELKEKVKQAEKSPSVSLDKAISESEKWKIKYRK